ncbi:Pkinase-domain-containing protein [Coemansia reversa NRRL 1564]|uniref:non-specific serine/threonine protein kinase n=1 Tax=Coemansia reversa (strain ATCC 12441 / NRRL 1564) TaxID=763665 RepID=A0A2G5B0R7_COERN|nr:Pkinase-domain-containing protein [Coemansia reversa NRRL 1564]|eukprot:PIA12604.1 Pkinase-domain-containing protein [Coemansia reversa NRRL 1564]
MADTAVSAGEAARRREHLPRQQPQQPLRSAVPVQSGSNVANRLVATAEQQAGGYGRERSTINPHPGTSAAPIAKGKLAGTAAQPSGTQDNSGHSQLPPRPQATESYLQQRTSGTTKESVFNARDPSPANAAPASMPIPDGDGQRRTTARQLTGQSSRATSSGNSSSSRRMVGPYQLAKTIGAGSMGKVKVALDTRTNKRVAAKIIPLQQSDAPVYFPNGLDTTAQVGQPTNAAHSGPVNPSAEPWRSWLAGLALESYPALAAAAGVSVQVQRKLRLLQPRERYTTKDRERRENKDIRVVREVAINRLLHHPHICMLHDVVVHPSHYYIFQELVSGGQMLDYIISHGRLKEKHARKFARQIASAISYCHHNSIVHRDLKIENILISANGNIKLIDFGLSNLYSPRSQLSTFCGSLYFAAPELLNAQPYTGPEVDLWSFGVVLYVLVCGKVPFDDQSMPALHAKIKRGHVEYPSWLTPECRHLLSRLLVVSPQRRATMAEVVRHPWMCKSYVDHPLVNNYLPTRIPLVAPEQIDRDVVREMARYIGFGFGSEDEIRAGLEAILTEDWYRAWLKDRLAPHLTVLRSQVQEQTKHTNPLPTATPLLAKDAAALRESNACVTSALDVSSGPTLTNLGDPALQEAAAVHEAQQSDIATSKLASRPSQVLRPTHPVTPPITTTDPSASDSVRKRSSFWKRSSTFISGGLARAAQKASPETLSSGSQSPAAAAATVADKHQPGQFRVLSGRIFSEGRQLAAPGIGSDGSAANKYPVLPLSAHVPAMHMDSSSGMVNIWKDGKLAPPDTDCAAIQQEYHDLIATDPLLSIYYLVKERREREARHVLRHFAHVNDDTRVRSATAHSSTGDGPAVSTEAWVKLERVSEKPPTQAHADTPSQICGAQAARDIVSVLATDADGAIESKRKPLNDSKAVSDTHQSAAPPDLDSGKESSEAVDQTTAAIEALSLHPRSRGSGSLIAPAQGSVTQQTSTGFSDSRKKRSNIFKRFSVIVKGARTGPKSAGTYPDSSSRIVQAEGKESGYMEISVHKSSDGNSNDFRGTDCDVVASGDDSLGSHSASTSQKQQHSLPLHLITPEAIGARLRGTVSAQRYKALDSIEEDREYVADTSAAGPASESALKASVDHTGFDACDITEQLSEKATRQYLDKPFCLQKSSGGEVSVQHKRDSSELLHPTAHESNSVLVNELTPVNPPNACRKGDCDGFEAEMSAGLADHKGPASADRARARDAEHSSRDLDDTSSMFTSADICYNVPVGSPGLDVLTSEKAALLEKARREIEGLDEQEGVGLLDQTPELSYRVAGQFSKTETEPRKRRVRSSSNTVVRMLTEIVRESGNNLGGRGSRAVQDSSPPQHSAKSSSPPVPGQSRQIQASKAIPRHSSTGAINRAGGQNKFQRPAARDQAFSGSTDLEYISAGRPDILRSHSHTIGHQQRTMALPAQISECPESPAHRAAANALGIESAAASGMPSIEVPTADSKCEGLSNPSIARSPSIDNASAIHSSKHSSGSDIAGLNSSMEPVSSAAADSAVDTPGDDLGSGIDSAPPRADEHLKPVFLKGLFSVATTSTRSPTVIRANLLGVLANMPLRFHEGKGYFTCSMTTAGGPTDIQEGALDTYAHDDPATSKNSSLHKQKRPLRLPVVDRKISFRRKSKRMDEAALALTVSGDKFHPSNDASSNDGNASDSHQSASESAGAHTSSRRQKRLSRRGPKGNAICFQIFLVRMPLLGLHGLQFRRVSGPAWRYKDVCSEILKQLKL